MTVRMSGIRTFTLALQRAIRLLRANELSPHYAAAFTEWGSGGEDSAWDAAVADGLNRD